MSLYTAVGVSSLNRVQPISRSAVEGYVRINSLYRPVHDWTRSETLHEYPVLVLCPLCLTGQ